MRGRGKTQQQLTPLELQLINVLWDCAISPSETQRIAETGVHHRADDAQRSSS